MINRNFFSYSTIKICIIIQCKDGIVPLQIINKRGNYSEPLIESMWLFVQNRENKKPVFTQLSSCWWITNRWLISCFHLCGLLILFHHFCISNPIFIGFWIDLATPVPWNNNFIHSHFNQWINPDNSLFYWLCAKIVLSDFSERRWSVWQRTRWLNNCLCRLIH